MPLDDSKLSQDMLKALRDNLKAKYPDAQPQPFQEDLTKAISKAVVTTLKSVAIAPALVPAPVVTGTGKGITLEPNLMVITAKTYLIGQVGQIGEAFEDIAKAVMESIESHLKEATVSSISGFGGQPGPILNVLEPTLSPAIIANLPPETIANLQKSQYGLIFIKAISSGIATGITAGQAALVPFGSTPPPPGLLIAKFS